MPTDPRFSQARRIARVVACCLPLLGFAPREGGASRTFFNVLLAEGADPWVIRHTDGFYYLTASNGRNVTLRRSRSLVGIEGGEERLVWTPPASGPKSREIWAPEIHHLDGKWYIYYAADDGENANHRMYVLENAHPDPFQGSFVDAGKIYDKSNDRWAIDGTVLNARGKLYFVWSGWEGDVNVSQNLYIAPMTDPRTIGGARVKISEPDRPWERIGNPLINEGPEILIKGRTINLVYSASGSWTDDYCLGLLTADLDANLLAPGSWTKRPEPVFRRAEGIFGPGHASFVKSPDGLEDWIVYHVAREQGSGWTRNVRAQPFGWNPDDTPRFGVPAPPDLPIPLPGGEPPRDRHEAEAATLSGQARAVDQPGASGGRKVTSLDAPGSFVEFVLNVPEAGTYLASVRFRGGRGPKGDATQTLSVNGRTLRPIRYPNSGRDRWSSRTFAVELSPGRNTIRLGPGEGSVEVDCLDLVPAK